jgi:hypothetical protein
MKTLLITLIYILALSIYAFSQSDNSQKSGTIYIPKDLEDCFIQINKILPDSVKQSMLTQDEHHFTSNMHFGLGLWMRNNWGLWKGSRLSKYFNDLGIYHPDDMSGIILDSYYRNSTGKEIKLEEQIKYYQNYWKVARRPSKDTYPNGVKKLEFNSMMYYESKMNGQGCVHVGTSPKSKDIWLYDYYLGWTKVSEADIKRIEQNYKTREDVLIEIFNRTKK